MPAMPAARPADHAYFCPQCGLAMRPIQGICPHCQGNCVLPPALALELRSAAEGLVPIQLNALAITRPPARWLMSGARVIDFAICGALTFAALLLFIRRLELVPLLILGNWLLVDALVVPKLRGTLGMRALGLELVDHRTGQPPDLVQALLRWLGGLSHVLTLGLLGLTELFDPQQRGWPERIAGLRIRERGVALR